MGNGMGERVRGRNKKRSDQRKEKKRAHLCEPSHSPHAKRFTIQYKTTANVDLIQCGSC